MLAAAPAKIIERTSNETSTQVVPAYRLELHTFNASTMRLIAKEDLGTIYRTQTTERPTKHYEKIIDRTIPGNLADLAEGRTVSARTLRGREVAQLRADPAPTAKAPLGLAANTLADLIAPAIPRPNSAGKNPFTGLAAAIAGKALADALTETPKEKAVRERREKDEAAKLKTAQTDLDHARAEIAAKIQGAKNDAKTDGRTAIEARATPIEAITTSAAATPEAARAALEIARTIGAQIDAPTAATKESTTETARAQDDARSVAIAIPTETTLAARYENEGAEGRFKAHILEALTAENPAVEAIQTIKMLEGTAFGAALIARVEHDRSELPEIATTSTRKDSAPEELSTPFAGLIESLDLGNATFPARLRKHAQEHEPTSLAA